MFSEEEKMGPPLVGETELSEALVNAGKNLLKPHSSTKALLHLLNEAEAQLSKLVQDPTVAVQNALRPLMKALVSAHLLRNRDSDVSVCVVSCLTEIMRITAPEAPYNDDQMKENTIILFLAAFCNEIFQVTVRAFGKLGDSTCHGYEKAVTVLDTVSRVRLSLVMLDLECDDLILKMFRQFLKVIRPNHPESVLLSMEAIMVTVIHESEEVPMDLLEILLSAVNKESQDVSPMASWLVEKVLISCACTLQTCIIEALKSTKTSLDMYSPVVLAICQGEAEEYIVVKPKQVEGQLDFRLSHKGYMSKRIARCGTRAHGDEKVKDDKGLKQLLKQVHSESSADAETESGSTRKRGRELNSLMNPLEGYSFKTSSSKKVQEKELGKLTAKKASLPSKVGQTNQSAVSSLSASSKAKKGSRKRSWSKIEETNLDAGSLATLASKKQLVKKDDPEEENFMESDLEKPEDSIKTAKSSKKERAQNGSAKASAGKPPPKFKDERAQNGLAKTSAKEPLAITPSTKESEQTPKRKRAAREEVDSHKSELDEELVGKRMKVWWPLDKKLRRQKAKKSKNVCKNVELSTSSDVRSSKKKNDPVTNYSTKLKGVSNEQESREDQNLKSSKTLNAETGGTKGRAEKRQKVTPPMHQESEKDKEEPETKGDESLRFGKESNAEPECKRDHQESLNAETKAEVQERESAKKTPADTKLIEKEDISEKSHRDAYTSVAETGKVENEDDWRVVKELEEGTDKA
ncbi:hypothetical protein Bca101_044278 [Brassica carinata]